MLEASPQRSYDFFISYTAKDEAWAEWIAWQLKELGHTFRFQKWHFYAGNDWVAEMQKSLATCRRMIAVLSPDYQKSQHGQAEWNVFYAKDASGSQALLLPVRVSAVELDDLHLTRTYIDFVGRSAEDCLRVLLHGIKPLEPSAPPTFPPAALPETREEPPPFPGATARLAQLETAKEPARFGPVNEPALSTATFSHNLPRLQCFHGREAELAALRDALDPAASTWGAVIMGPGGLGKTSLAVRAAYDCDPGHFERIIFLSVKTREMDDGGERDLSGFILSGLLEMLNELARELGEPDITKAPEEQRFRLLHDALRGRRALLILDNLESLTRADRDHLLTFAIRLPQGCKALLTSRERIGPSADSLMLDKLGQEAALETLHELARRNPLLARTTLEERISLYEQSDGSPLLLCWVAGQLGRGHCRTLAEALEHLRSCPKRSDALKFIFGDLTRSLTPSEHKILCTMTYLSLPARVEHLAALTDLDAHTVKVALQGLANRSLVVTDLEGTHYGLVSIFSAYLRKHHRASIGKLADRIAAIATTLIEENGLRKYESYERLEEAWPVVAAAIPLFIAGPNPRLQHLSYALRSFLNFMGRWDERLSFSLRAEERALEAEDFLNAGWRACDAASLLNRRGQLDELLNATDRVSTHWERHGKGVREHAVLHRLEGHALRLAGRYTEAIAAYEESVRLWRSIAARDREIIFSLNGLAEALRHHGRLDEAGNYYLEALGIATSINDAEGIATHTGNLAALAIDRNQWTKAEALAREALPLAEKVYRKELIAVSCHRLAQSLQKQGKATEALPHARRAVDIYSLLKSSSLKAAIGTLQECEAAI